MEPGDTRFVIYVIRWAQTKGKQGESTNLHPISRQGLNLSQFFDIVDH